MPRFTLKMNVFPPNSFESPINVCVETLRTGLHFYLKKTIDLRGNPQNTCLGLL